VRLKTLWLKIFGRFFKKKLTDEKPKGYDLPEGITPAREIELVIRSLPTRPQRRRAVQNLAKQIKQAEIPDLLRGMSNHQRMVIKKIGRGSAETRSRVRRNK
jgi:hypothetical protein